MKVEVFVEINGRADDVWTVLTDIDHAADHISGIEKIEILERPSQGIVGLKWRETRTMFGKEATEVMWITDADENRSYRTRAESHGAVYVSGFDLETKGQMTRLTMFFRGEAKTFMAKLMNVIFSGMMKKSTQKAMEEDLYDIKRIVES